MRADDKVTLADPAAAYNFYVGMPVHLGWRRDGRLFRLRGIGLVLRRARWAALRWTRWFRTRTVVSAIDQIDGVLTFTVERWSWRRWRWERT